LEREVELVQALAVRQSRQLQRIGEAAGLADGDLRVQDEVEELAVAQLGVLGALAQLLSRVGQVRQLQPFGVTDDAFGDQLTHHTPPRSWQIRS
jgi:DNA mismatch repair protein MutH